MKPQTLDEAVLEELVYECLRQYLEVWKATLLARELADSIELARSKCAPTREAQDALVATYTDRAWARLERTPITPN